MTDHASTGPLDGTLVVDFTMYLSGPLATGMMADNGARVIKVEPPAGEPSRLLGSTHRSHPDLFEPGVSAVFEAYSRGKESLVADLKNPADLDVIKKLIAKADVLCENFRPGVMKHLGLDYESLKAVNPRLVYVSISGFGQTGAYAGRAAFDVVIQATSGFMASTGFPDGLPTKSGASIADCTAGVYAYAACVTALYGREKTGMGCYCDIAMQDAMMGIQGDQLAESLISGKPAGRSGNDVQQMHPFGVFECKAGSQLAICIASQQQFNALADAMGFPQWKGDARFKFPVPIATEHRKDFDDEFFPALKSKSADEWIKIFDASHLPSARLFDYQQISEEPYLRERKMVLERSNGAKVIGSPMKLSTYPDVADNLPSAPKLDEQGEAIRQEFS